MAGNNAFEQILNEAVEKAQKDSPTRMKYLTPDGKTRYKDADEFFHNLSDSFIGNDLLSGTRSFAVRSSAFALRVLNSVDATKRIQGNIEDFFSDEANNEWFAQQGITTDDEKKKLKETLTNYVEEQLDVNPKTVEGRQFVERMKEVYDECADIDKDFFLQNGCAFIQVVNDMVAENGNDYGAFDTALMIWREDDVDKDYGLVASAMYNSLASDYKELSSEIDRSPKLVQHFGLYFGDSVKVKPVEFLEHAKTGEFTLEDKIWAEGNYQSIVEQGIFRSVDMTDFRVNGKPMFSEEELQNKDMDELSCKIVENMLKGEDISINRPGREPVRLDVNLNEWRDPTKKNFIERFFDFIKELVTGEKSKIEQMKKDFAANKEEKKAIRKRISFDELTGKNVADKITTAPSKDNQLSAERKLEKDMSAGR